MTLDGVSVELNKNNSLVYFLPFLHEKVNLGMLDRIENSDILNREGDGEFSVLYKFSAKTDFLAFEERIINDPLCIGHEDYDEYVIYKFKLTDDLKSKLKLIESSNFNTYSRAEKVLIVNFLNLRGDMAAMIIEKRLNGQLGMKDTKMRDEVFFNCWSRITVETANDLYNKTERD